MHIRCVVFDQVNLLDVAGPAQVFAAAGQLRNDVSVAFEVCSLRGGLIHSDAGVTLASQELSSEIAHPDLVLVPGSAAISRHVGDHDLIAAIRGQADAAALVVSVCTGSLLLAEAGLLRNKTAATHWRYADQLRDSHADIRVNEDAIFVEDGAIWTSAGVSSGIDMALALVARFWGRALALDVARELVVPMVRTGGQKQYSALLEIQRANRTSMFDELNAWVYDHVAEDCRVEKLAERCGMSPRSFARHYRDVVGETPARMVERIRVDRARSLLETTDADLGGIARSCGFSSAHQLSLSFERVQGVTPTVHRKNFGVAQDVAASRSMSRGRSQAR